MRLTLIITYLIFIDEILEDDQNTISDQKEKLRGNTIGGLILDIFNFILVWGCEPGVGILSDSKMVSDVSNAFMTKFDPKKMILEFPTVLEHL